MHGEVSFFRLPLNMIALVSICPNLNKSSEPARLAPDPASATPIYTLQVRRVETVVVDDKGPHFYFSLPFKLGGGSL